MPFANNNGVKIHYEVQGPATAPSLVMQHGLTVIRGLLEKNHS